MSAHGGHSANFSKSLSLLFVLLCFLVIVFFPLIRLIPLNLNRKNKKDKIEVGVPELEGNQFHPL